VFGLYSAGRRTSGLPWRSQKTYTSPNEWLDQRMASRNHLVQVAEFAEKTVCLQRNRGYYGKCGMADELKLQDFPHFGRPALMNLLLLG
jgi:hypothetical protein